MTFLGLLIFSFAAFRMIPVSPLPDVDIPEITVFIYKDNTPAAALETAIVSGMRTQLSQIANVEHVGSESYDGHARIDIRFRYGTNINYAFIEANEKIDVLMRGLPGDVPRPRVIKANVSDIPVFDLDISYKDPVKARDREARSELNEFANKVIKRALEQLPEIALVDITGSSGAGIVIRPRTPVLRSLGLDEKAISGVLAANDIDLPAIRVKDGIMEYDLHFVHQGFHSPEDIAAIRFEHKGRTLQLSDIAAVGMDDLKVKGKFLADGADALNLRIIKQPDARMSNLLENSHKVIAGFEADYPYLTFRQTRNETALLDFSISNLQQDLLLGSVLALLMLFLFIRNGKTPLLIAIVVPTALFLSLGFFYLLHLSLNIISLSGLVLGVGLMIDNSIIIIDNITQKKADHDIAAACAIGVREVITPLACSALTTTSVFVPLVFLNGIAGSLFRDEAMAVTIGLLTSLAVAITLLPVLYHSIHKNDKPRSDNGWYRLFDKLHIPRRVQATYEHGFILAFSYKKILLAFILPLLIASFFAVRRMTIEQLPAFETNETLIKIDWNTNINLEEGERRVTPFLGLNKERIRHSDVFLGEQQFLLAGQDGQSLSQCTLYLEATDRQALTGIRSSAQSYFTARFPASIVDVSKPPTIFEKVFGNDDYDVIAQISRDTRGRLPSDSSIMRLLKRIKSAFPLLAVKNIPFEKARTLKLNMSAMAQYRLTPEMVYDKLKYTLNAKEENTTGKGQYPLDLNIGTPGSHSYNSVIAETFVRNPDNVDVPLRSLVDTGSTLTYRSVAGDEKGFFIPLVFRQVAKPLVLMDSLSRWAGQDPSLRISFSGQYFSSLALSRGLLTILGVTILLLYFILAAQFGSLVQPLIVLVELPVSICASLLILYLCGQTLNIMSMIGLIVMCGIIINDSILKIDTINQLYRKEGVPLVDAIHEAGIRRINSIVMTAMTTVLSVVPFLFGNDLGSVMQRPLSIALIGGVVSGTFVSLFIVPVLYWYCFKSSIREK